MGIDHAAGYAGSAGCQASRSALSSVGPKVLGLDRAPAGVARRARSGCRRHAPGGRAVLMVSLFMPEVSLVRAPHVAARRRLGEVGGRPRGARRRSLAAQVTIRPLGRRSGPAVNASISGHGPAAATPRRSRKARCALATASRASPARVPGRSAWRWRRSQPVAYRRGRQASLGSKCDGLLPPRSPTSARPITSRWSRRRGSSQAGSSTWVRATGAWRPRTGPLRFVRALGWSVAWRAPRDAATHHKARSRAVQRPSRPPPAPG